MNTTSVPEVVGWVPIPIGGRGTFQLLVSCAVTTFLCTWSAVHLNVPPDHKPMRWFILRKLKWMSVGVVCPEYIALMALTEWWDARFLRKELRSMLKDKVFAQLALIISTLGTKY